LHHEAFSNTADREGRENNLPGAERRVQRTVLMATTDAIHHQLVPLHHAGNTTEVQNQKLRAILTDAAGEAALTALEQLDQLGVQAVLEVDRKIRREAVEQLIATIHRYTTSDKFKDEEVASDRTYPATYRIRPIEAQVTELRKLFPGLGTCQERLARKELPEEAEAWFAVPRWEKIAPTYGEAVTLMLDLLAQRRKVSNRIIGKISNIYLRQTERTKLAERILSEQQIGHDILAVGAQAGLLHRGSSARRTRVALAGHEFALGAFAIGCMLLTHPERLSSGDTLMIDCGGDEYSVRGDYEFDRVPLFDYNGGGIEFSIFYEDRARNLWGTPTGFLYKPA
jgi:hypothetical protein